MPATEYHIDNPNPPARTQPESVRWAIVFWSCVFALILGLEWLIIRGEVEAITATRWPTTPGQIVNVDFIDGKSYITYRYEVDGKRYEGNRISGKDETTREQAHVGQSVTVYYYPDDPGRAMLEPGLREKLTAAVMTLTSINLILLSLFWPLLRTLRRDLAILRAQRADHAKQSSTTAPTDEDPGTPHEPAAAFNAQGFEVTIIEQAATRQGRVVRLRLPIPWQKVFLWLGVASIFGMIIVNAAVDAMFGMRIHETPWTLVVYFALTVGWPLVEWRRQVTGRRDLVIDGEAGTLFLPGRFPWDEAHRIPLTDITDIRRAGSIERSEDAHGAASYRTRANPGKGDWQRVERPEPDQATVRSDDDEPIQRDARHYPAEDLDPEPESRPTEDALLYLERKKRSRPVVCWRDAEGRPAGATLTYWDGEGASTGELKDDAVELRTAAIAWLQRELQPYTQRHER